MAITKLMHMKEDKVFPSNHLRDTINYILDVKHNGEKTEYGLWVGGNVGTEADVVYQKFMGTKKAWGKENGRQGYHFVISFAPGETDEATCCEVLKKFCEEYLGDDYEYVYAVHNDKEHVHGHIVFNSVNRITGRKYRYENGDWEKYIQPITDKITQEVGLAPLVFEENRVGKHYADWATEKKGDLNWTSIIRADVDLAIKNSSTLEEFFFCMQKMGYEMRPGKRTKKTKSGEIIKEPSVTFYYTDSEGKVHRRRNHKLLKGTEEYSIQNIKAKIENKQKMQEPYYETIASLLEKKAAVYLKMKAYMQGYKTFSRLYQAVGYYRLPNPFAVPLPQVRNDILRIDKLIEECAYIKRNPPKNEHELEIRAEKIDVNLKTLYIKRRALRKTEEEFRLLISQEKAYQYKKLKQEYLTLGEDDDRWEILDDEIKEIEKDLPAAYISNANELLECESKIEIIKNEKRILERVIKTEGGKRDIFMKEKNMSRVLK